MLLWAVYVGFIINANLILDLCCPITKPFEEQDTHMFSDILAYFEFVSWWGGGEGWKINL